MTFKITSLLRNFSRHFISSIEILFLIDLLIILIFKKNLMKLDCVQKDLENLSNTHRCRLLEKLFYHFFCVPKKISLSFMKYLANGKKVKGNSEYLP